MALLLQDEERCDAELAPTQELDADLCDPERRSGGQVSNDHFEDVGKLEKGAAGILGPGGCSEMLLL